MATYKSFEDALAARPANAAPSTAANDNKPTKPRKKRVRNNTTLPALRWLYDNHPDLAPAMASAVKELARTDWNTGGSDGELEIRPTVGEIVNAASEGKDTDGKPIWLVPNITKDGIELGALKFKGNEIVEYGRTAKGRKLEPRERMSSRGSSPSGTRNPRVYLSYRGAIPSPMHAEGVRRPISSAPALAPMYDPQRNVEDNRAVLQKFGVDGGVPFDALPFPATRCPTTVAEGAEFLGGVVGSSGNASSGALMWEAPYIPKGEVRRIVEDVAAGATLKAIGEGLGFVGVRVDRGAKDALLDAASALLAANDNRREKKKAA